MDVDIELPLAATVWGPSVTDGPWDRDRKGRRQEAVLTGVPVLLRPPP
jgi:hypothetical protein